MARTVKTPTGVAVHIPLTSVVEIDGVKLNLEQLFAAIQQPNTEALFAFKRVGNALKITKIEDTDSAIAFLIAATRRKRERASIVK
ncbi:MAG: hypothetical protein ACO3ON_10450 [Ilumatobacteraceae bacterium]|jgi:hypothetical protein